MACYDCEDCCYHEDNGGKCDKFEYDCPYSIFNGYKEGCPTKEDVRQLMELAQSLDTILTKMDEIMDRCGLYSNDFDSVRGNLNYLLEDLSENNYKEWLSIKGE